MNYSLHTAHITLTDLDRTDIDKKLERFERYLTPPYVVDITLDHSTHHRTGQVVACRINIEQGKNVFHCERNGETIQDCLDEVIDVLQRELKEHREKARSLSRTTPEEPEPID